MDWKDILFDTSKWPTYENIESLRVLDEMADDAHHSFTDVGYISSILIRHQLLEEVIMHLVRFSHLVLHCSLYPEVINIDLPRKPMTGNLIQKLKDSIEFDKKKEFIEICEELNKLRIDIVHYLKKDSTLNNLRVKADQYEKLLDQSFTIHSECQKDLIQKLGVLKNDRKWKEA